MLNTVSNICTVSFSSTFKRFFTKMWCKNFKYFVYLFYVTLIVIVNVRLVHASLIAENAEVLEYFKYKFFPNHVRNINFLKGDNLNIGILQIIPGELAQDITPKYKLFLLNIKFSILTSWKTV